MDEPQQFIAELRVPGLPTHVQRQARLSAITSKARSQGRSYPDRVPKPDSDPNPVPDPDPDPDPALIMRQGLRTKSVIGNTNKAAPNPRLIIRSG
jgi:hypothetical protein